MNNRGPSVYARFWLGLVEAFGTWLFGLPLWAYALVVFLVTAAIEVALYQVVWGW